MFWRNISSGEMFSFDAISLMSYCDFVLFINYSGVIFKVYTYFNLIGDTHLLSTMNILSLQEVQILS